MTTPSGASPEDHVWRRPAPDQPGGGPADADRPGGAEGAGAGRPGTPGTVPGAGGAVPGGGYAGPPPTTPPPPGWRPPVHLQPTPPRQLPPQDMVAMDNAEQRAQRLTFGIGTVAGVVLVILLCLLCSRLIL